MAEVENIDDHMALACECGCVRFHLLKSKDFECSCCGKKLANMNRLDVRILLDTLVTAAKGEGLSPDRCETVESIAKDWCSDEFDKDDIQALYDCGPHLFNKRRRLNDAFK